MCDHQQTGRPVIEILTTCTARKSDTPTSAERLYRGEQFVRMMRGVQRARQAGHDVSVWIVSAKHGLIHGQSLIAPYNETFSGQSREMIRAVGHYLRLPEHVGRFIQHRPDVLLIGLSDPYIEACGLLASLPSCRAYRVEMWTSAKWASMIRNVAPRVHTHTLTNEEAKSYRCPLLALKGELMAQWLEQVAG